ncbi:6-phosphogluconolactonase [Stutzerimonas azotifigens]|uniref:6-phosphogluconolactonase n=1 Tax=Stutzerimonas azotifigens TaxID=291995 RepID=A0ABR5Z3E4_9GAMM|nr:6-phosphogluconolactonase [Stutzerimonas azotifigens]MBA1274666.1 6-phosphogluconolactonase [Stutzerimonas azotifigens]
MAIFELELPSGVVAHSLANAEKQAEALARTVAEALNFAIETDGCASLVVSGGRSPIRFFEALSAQSLDWSKVQVSLADERWVPPSHSDSNEGLVRRHLLQNEAGKARFVGLYQATPTLAEAVAGAEQGLAALKRPLDVLVLGMGDDGHTASLFPGNPGLGEALEQTCEVACVPMLAPAAPHQRISLTYPLLASARLQCLAIQGEAKLDTLRRALTVDPVQMPIRAFLHSPLEIYWCP